MNTRVGAIFLLAVVAVSCRYPNQFTNTPRGQPHAVLRGSNNAFPGLINRQRPSFWRWGDVHRISPGTNEVRAAYSDRKETISYKSLQFFARPGYEYTVIRKREPGLASPLTAEPHPITSDAWLIYDQRDRVVIERRDTSGTRSIVAEAPREDAIFNTPSMEEAMAKYRRENP